MGLTRHVFPAYSVNGLAPAVIYMLFTFLRKALRTRRPRKRSNLEGLSQWVRYTVIIIVFVQLIPIHIRFRE